MRAWTRGRRVALEGQKKSETFKSSFRTLRAGDPDLEF